MALCIVSCGIFQPELEKILPEMQEVPIQARDIRFVSPGLHVDTAKLEQGITNALEPFTKQTEQNIILLYGSMCHPELSRIAAPSAAVYPKMANCIEAILSPERKREIEGTANVFYLTMGWLRYWREIFQHGQGWDPVDARIYLGSYDKILVLDSGCYEISEEALFEFFDYVQVPIEVEPITLDYFKGIILELYQQFITQETTNVHKCSE